MLRRSGVGVELCRVVERGQENEPVKKRKKSWTQKKSVISKKAQSAPPSMRKSAASEISTDLDHHHHHKAEAEADIPYIDSEVEEIEEVLVYDESGPSHESTNDKAARKRRRTSSVSEVRV